MAKLNKASTSADIRGKAGNTVTSSNQNGWYLKLYTAPSDPKTEAQQQIRTAFTLATKQWKTLDLLKQVAWGNWAAAPAQKRYDWWGNEYSLNGFQAFTGCAVNLYLATGSFPTNPPPGARLNAPSRITVYKDYPLPALTPAILLEEAVPADSVALQTSAYLRWNSSGIQQSGPNKTLGYLEVEEDVPLSIQTQLEACYGYAPASCILFTYFRWVDAWGDVSAITQRSTIFDYGF